MALSTKTKPSSPGHKKFHAAHHRQSKHYLKTYWPYLPILSLAGLGVYLALSWHYGGGANLAHGQSLAAYSLLNVIESSVGIGALAFFLLRHAFAWRKVFQKSEAFAIKHPLLDIALVAIAVIGLLLAHHNIVPA